MRSCPDHVLLLRHWPRSVLWHDMGRLCPPFLPNLHNRNGTFISSLAHNLGERIDESHYQSLLVPWSRTMRLASQRQARHARVGGAADFEGIRISSGIGGVDLGEHLMWHLGGHLLRCSVRDRESVGRPMEEVVQVWVRMADLTWHFPVFAKQLAHHAASLSRGLFALHDFDFGQFGQLGLNNGRGRRGSLCHADVRTRSEIFQMSSHAG